jgi:hypothetical protein
MYKKQHFQPSKCISSSGGFLISGFIPTKVRLDFPMFSLQNGAVLNAVCSLNDDDVSDGLSLCMFSHKKSRRALNRVSQKKNP